MATTKRKCCCPPTYHCERDVCAFCDAAGDETPRQYGIVLSGVVPFCTLNRLADVPDGAFIAHQALASFCFFSAPFAPSPTAPVGSPPGDVRIYAAADCSGAPYDLAPGSGGNYTRTQTQASLTRPASGTFRLQIGGPSILYNSGGGIIDSKNVLVFSGEVTGVDCNAPFTISNGTLAAGFGTTLITSGGTATITPCTGYP
jgi:hypothetical protein